MNTKQVIVIRKDLKMRRGKEIAQGAHASMLWLREHLGDRIYGGSVACMSDAERHWMEGDYRKIVVTAEDEAHLNELYNKAVSVGLNAHLVTDLGLTQFKGVPTITALAIGPDVEADVDLVTAGLPLY